ncbi:hypothetical protein U9M48_028882 [Paspalum notatum var. saurae]|uniref:Uncharacterized protein n=1 Tax=Paspalum notatum var. saurae TaxID=547442 RepID=A0AAQ3U205_PASNO
MAHVHRKRKRDCEGDEEHTPSTNSVGYDQKPTASYLNSLGDDELFDVIKKFAELTRIQGDRKTTEIQCTTVYMIQ